MTTGLARNAALTSRHMRALVVVVAFASALTSGIQAETASASAIATGCEQPTPQTLAGSPPRAATRAGSNARAASLTPLTENSKIVNRNFGDSREIFRRPLAFIADRPLVVDTQQIVVSIAGGLVDPTTTDVFPIDNGQVSFGVATDPASPNLLTVKICIDPGHPSSVSPGQYAGTLLISGPGITPAQIPITLTLKSSKVWLVWLLAIAGLILGISVKVIATNLNPRETAPDHPWLRILSMFVIGAVLTIGVVIKLYYEPTTFGDSFSSFWPIVIGAATATAGGTTLVDLFKGT